MLMKLASLCCVHMETVNWSERASEGGREGGKEEERTRGNLGPHAKWRAFVICQMDMAC